MQLTKLKNLFQCECRSAPFIFSVLVSTLLLSCSSELGSECESKVGNGYCLVWQDEFKGSSLDLGLWSHERNCTGGGNNEAQCYVSDAKNVWVDGEYLHVKAIREDVTGPSKTDDENLYDPNDKSGSGTFSSGRIRSKGKGDWRYGRFEIRAKLPAGQGTWPAIWMLPTEWVYGGWASSGEIDIMEAVNLKVGGERQVHGTLHFGDNHPNNVYSGEAYTLPQGSNPADDFHVYAIEWEDGEIRWYVDDYHFASQTKNGWYSKAALDKPAAPFDQRFHLILNLAVGGDWAGNVNDTGIDESAFPQEMIVDYVRVYECSLDPESGAGCATRGDNFVANPGVKPPQVVDIPSAAEDFVLFNGLLTAPFEWQTWTNEGDIAYRVISVGGEYGDVAEVSFNSNEGVGYFQSSATTDFSAFKAIEFDLKVVSDSRTDKGVLEFRADCVYPCSSGNYSIGYPGLNVWTHYSIPLASLSSMGLDLTKVNTPFVIAPVIGNGKGLIVQVDNVILKVD